MTAAPQLLLSALLLAGSVSQAAAVQVCLQDRANVGAPARASLVRELHALLPGMELEIVKCNAASVAGVQLTILSSRAGIPDDALGLAHRADGAILPRLEVFVDPVLRLTRTRDGATLGRALARVASHELLHYLKQTSEHQAHGLLRERLSPADLVSEEVRPRLVAALNHD